MVSVLFLLPQAILKIAFKTKRAVFAYLIFLRNFNQTLDEKNQSVPFSFLMLTLKEQIIRSIYGIKFQKL
jgi:hypothetical protein